MILWFCVQDLIKWVSNVLLYSITNIFILETSEFLLTSKVGNWIVCILVLLLAVIYSIISNQGLRLERFLFIYEYTGCPQAWKTKKIRKFKNNWYNRRNIEEFFFKDLDFTTPFASIFSCIQCLDKFVLFCDIGNKIFFLVNCSQFVFKSHWIKQLNRK